ncbi:hypothetical protein AGLY_001681 [Aphis glycines]|uniref:Uncharacterized protein n=1 Tax=Aphis glycines TaxID=307491 RepID=A0A6G0U6T2_APHGL|nr:hypothetical protein AGLY_001681 [Aphis glycines]
MMLIQEFLYHHLHQILKFLCHPLHQIHEYLDKGISLSSSSSSSDIGISWSYSSSDTEISLSYSSSDTGISLSSSSSDTGISLSSSSSDIRISLSFSLIDTGVSLSSSSSDDNIIHSLLSELEIISLFLISFSNASYISNSILENGLYIYHIFRISSKKYNYLLTVISSLQGRLNLIEDLEVLSISNDIICLLFKANFHLEIDGDARVFSTSGVLSISNTCFSIGFTISLLAIGVFNELSSIFLRFSLETISSTGDRFLVLVFAEESIFLLTKVLVLFLSIINILLSFKLELARQRVFNPLFSISNSMAKLHIRFAVVTFTLKLIILHIINN